MYSFLLESMPRLPHAERRHANNGFNGQRSNSVQKFSIFFFLNALFLFFVMFRGYQGEIKNHKQFDF